jgi:hypothetical protein
LIQINRSSFDIDRQPEKIRRFSSGPAVTDHLCNTCGGSSKKSLLHKYDDFFQPFLFAPCIQDDKPAGKFVLYLFLTPVIAVAISIYLFHSLLREFYFDMSIVRLACMTGSSGRLKQVPLWQKILSYPLFLIGVLLYIVFIYYMTIPLGIIFVPINLYL